MSGPLASEKLAEEFLVIPYPFTPEERRNLEAEYTFLLDSGISTQEISDMILYALELLLTKRKNTKDDRVYSRATSEVSDMLGRLLVLEELLMRGRKK